MIIYERQQKILDYLKQNKFANVKTLSQIVYSSESSVRRDVKALEARGYVKQVYGGVTLPGFEHGIIPVNMRESANTAVKEELAHRASEYVFDGATIIMDGSSTVRRIVKYIRNVHDIKIITNNARIFDEPTNPEITIYGTGGLYNAESEIFIGSGAEDYIRKINADILFFSTLAISDDGEISDASEAETALRKIMLTRAKKKIFLCDSSKIGVRRSWKVCDKDDVDVIICDTKLPWEK